MTRMLEVKREGAKVVVTLRTFIGWLWQFAFTTPDESYAAMLESSLEKEFEDGLQRIRRESYEQGYKDGRAKREKTKFFSCRWDR